MSNRPVPADGPGFGQMLAFLNKNRSKCQTILVEKTDRLYRNVPDYATVDELGVTIHFVKDGTILSPDSKSSESSFTASRS